MKKRIPLSLLKSIQPKIDEYKQFITLDRNNDSLIHLKDNDPKSNFFFNVKSNIGQGKYDLEFKPSRKTSTNRYKAETSEENVVAYLDQWLKMLSEYNNINSIFDDPIIKEYQMEFQSEFTSNDEDADFASFDLDKQLFLDGYFEMVIIKLENSITESNKFEIKEIIEEVTNLKSEQTKLSKNLVIIKLTKIWAKARKQGLDLLKEIYIESRKELIKHLIKGFIE